MDKMVLLLLLVLVAIYMVTTCTLNCQGYRDGYYPAGPDGCAENRFEKGLRAQAYFDTLTDQGMNHACASRETARLMAA